MDLDEGPFVGQHISTRTIAIWEAYVWGLKKCPSVQNGIEAPVKNYTSHKFRQVELARKTFEKQVELNETSRIESKMDQKGVFFLAWTQITMTKHTYSPGSMRLTFCARCF